MHFLFQTRDAIPDPNIITAVLKACRHQNDFPLALRFLETVQLKCGPHKKVVWPWLVQQIKPTLDDLGVPTPEEIGYDKPELYLEDVMDMLTAASHHYCCFALSVSENHRSSLHRLRSGTAGKADLCAPRL
ncbi:COX5A [Bugula neritina]|uniref:Cytochrome c oxidase subunit 5A, mitochondrial n=1 Tax=Bugula neritina TaxID=10212 RepID=A0A7J7JM76_BUGNE|nr:COX5A [Bugula neritina]